MADITIKVITPADSYDLVTLEELKIMLGISTTTEDARLAVWITQYSDVIATMCNRVFAKETVAETWCGDLPPYDTQRGRVFLTHYPVADADIESVTAPDGTTIDPANYVLENRSGKLQFLSAWAEPIQITYTGGYDLPEETPPALKQALALLIGAARVMQAREMTAGIRSISHRESRVQFFDVNAAMAKMGGSSPLSMASQTVDALLYHYIRFNV
jgi:gp6-like head-tail connector protein